jgi:hypothetical protein
MSSVLPCRAVSTTYCPYMTVETPRVSRVAIRDGRGISLYKFTDIVALLTAELPQTVLLVDRNRTSSQLQQGRQ